MALQPLPSTMPPVKFGGFHLTGDGLKVVGRPNLVEFRKALFFSGYVEELGPWWKALLIAYADSRPEWKHAVDHLVDSETMTEQSVVEYRRVAKAFPRGPVVTGASFSQHQAVVTLPAAEQTEWLEKARDEHLTVPQLRLAIKRKKHANVLQGQASDVAAVLSRISDAAYLAEQSCKAICQQDGKHAESKIADARRHLDACEQQVSALRAILGTR